MSYSPQSQTLRCPVHHRVWLCGFLSTAVTNSVVSCSLQSLTVLYVDWLCDVQFTTESDSVMSCLPKSLTLRCPAFCYLISCPHITAEIVLDLQSPQHCTYCTVSLHDKIVGAYIKYDTRGRQKIRQLCKSSTFISLPSWGSTLLCQVCCKLYFATSCSLQTSGKQCKYLYSWQLWDGLTYTSHEDN